MTILKWRNVNSEMQKLTEFIQNITQDISRLLSNFIQNFKQFGNMSVYDRLVSKVI